MGLIGERIDEAATDKQYIEYKKARRRNDTQGYVISSCEAGNYDYKDYYYYVKAVPKMNIAAPDVKVQKINSTKTRRPAVKEENR